MIVQAEQLAVANIVQPLSFTLNAGQLCAVVGPNGAGKTTLMQRLAGVQPVHSGQLLIEGQDARRWNAQQWAQKVAYLPQLSAVSFPLTAAEVIALGAFAQSFRSAELARLQAEAIIHWELEDLAERDVRSLSGGEQQRVQLARSWLQMQAPSAKLWLLDEPFSALDLHHQQLCLQHIQTLQTQGKAIIMVVHDLNLARLKADTVLLLQQGRLVDQGAATEVLNPQQVSQVFSIQAQLQGSLLHWLS